MTLSLVRDAARVPAEDPRLPRLLTGGPVHGRAMTAAAHLAHHGALPRLSPDALLELVADSGLRGRGGAGFPTARKLEAVRRRRRRPLLVANGAEGEPASRKDATLLTLAPHLVLDGAELVAAAIGADEVVVWVHRDPPAATRAVERALLERQARVAMRVVGAPSRFVAGESSAVVSGLEGAPVKPRGGRHRPSEKGVGGAPTLVHNVETLAQIGLLARHGARWFRDLGTVDEPGSMLLTVQGTVHEPGVLEVAVGTPLVDVLDPAETPQAVLVGGYHGAWLSAAATDVPLTHADLRAAGGALGAGIVVAIGPDDCGLAETARVLRYLAAESAGQCGPCVFGLPAIAGGFAELAEGRADAGTVERLERWAGQVRGRGACSHPDGTATLAESALRVFADDVQRHLSGPCGRRVRGLLPVPASKGEWR